MTRVRIFGCEVDALTLDETVERVREAVEARVPVQHVALNAAKVVMMRDEPRLFDIIRSCEIVSADGQPIVWASRLLGRPLPERVAGIDLFRALLLAAESHHYSVYLLGARSEVVREVAKTITRDHPGVRIAGYRDGYFSPEQNVEVVHHIRESAPDLLFVAMPTPQKEYWLADNVDSLGVPFSMGVGGSFDVVAGLTRRAPGWMRKRGLEWAHRFAQEPARMWRRYLVGNARFLVEVAREILRPRAGGG